MVEGRTSTGVAGLDAILNGGLLPDALYIISGRPGAGKTILANQIAFAHVRAGGRVVYATLLAETHARLIAQMRILSFYDEKTVGRELQYLNALEAVTDEGLPGLLELARRMVRDQRATLLVLDGMVTAERLAKSDAEYKRFISELQTWVGVVGCTVLFVTSSGMGPTISPEHTMVDGIIELSAELFQMRSLRRIAVTKFRGGAFLEGQHSYLITGDGLRVFPRIESLPYGDGGTQEATRLATGIPGLDDVLRGGLMSRSTTLLLGSSGAGKTVFGLQFLAEGARLGESSLHFGFYEPVHNVISKADRLGFEFTRLIDEDKLAVQWFRPAEVHIDGLVEQLLKLVRERGVKRLFIDGFVGFRSTHPSERISTVFSAVSDELVALGVTTIISDETRELFVKEVEVPTPNVSAIFHNIVFVRHVEVGAELLRLVSVMKTRDSGADRQLWRYEIGDNGISLVEPYAKSAQQLMSGGDGTGRFSERAQMPSEISKPKKTRVINSAPTSRTPRGRGKKR